METTVGSLGVHTQCSTVQLMQEIAIFRAVTHHASCVDGGKEWYFFQCLHGSRVFLLRQFYIQESWSALRKTCFGREAFYLNKGGFQRRGRAAIIKGWWEPSTQGSSFSRAAWKSKQKTFIHWLLTLLYFFMVISHVLHVWSLLQYKQVSRIFQMLLEHYKHTPCTFTFSPHASEQGVLASRVRFFLRLRAAKTPSYNITAVSWLHIRRRRIGIHTKLSGRIAIFQFISLIRDKCQFFSGVDAPLLHTGGVGFGLNVFVVSSQIKTVHSEFI